MIIFQRTQKRDQTETNTERCCASSADTPNKIHFRIPKSLKKKLFEYEI